MEGQAATGVAVASRRGFPADGPVTGSWPTLGLPRRWLAQWPGLAPVLLLLTIALGLRLWLVWDTEVAARDSIGYIRYAWQLGHRPWLEVVRTTEQPPAYALAVLAVSQPVRHLVSAPEST